MTTVLGPAPAQQLYAEETRAADGPGAPLVACIHGSMDRHSSFARLRARLMPTCDVLLYDRRGYAASRNVEPPASGIGDHVADLLALLAGRRAVLFGHSYGGDIALALAERHPELVATAIVYEAPLPWLDLWHPPGTARSRPPWSGTTPADSAERFLRRMVGDRRYERIPASTRTEILKDGPALVTELTTIRLAPPPFDPRRVEVPVVVACGSEALERHRRGAEWLASSLPNAVLRVIGGAAHDGHRTHSKEIAELVLTAVGQPSSSPTVTGVST